MKITIYPVEFYQNFFTRQWRWRIKASNGEIVAASTEGFWRKQKCERNAEITGHALAAHFQIDGTKLAA